MKCKDCDACHKGYFKSKPDDYVCIGVCEPFVIRNIDNECTEYKDLKESESGIFSANLWSDQVYKSRIFSFNEENLLRDIANYENYGGYEVTELQCNSKTANAWTGLYIEQLKHPVEFSETDREKGILGSYQGIPIKINEALDDGTVAIK